MTKAKATTSAATAGDKRLFYASLVIFLGVLALVIASVVSRNRPPESSGVISPQTVAPLTTLAPEIAANLTALPQGQALALSAGLSEQITDLEAQIKTCADYSPERRSQMEQHIAWLRDSSTMPREVVLGIAANPTGRLIVGMTTFTSAEWGQHDHAADSCLLPIGRYLNTLLTQTGEEAFKEFAG